MREPVTVDFGFAGWFRCPGRRRWLLVGTAGTEDEARELVRRHAESVGAMRFDSAVLPVGRDPNVRVK